MKCDVWGGLYCNYINMVNELLYRILKTLGFSDLGSSV